MFAPYPGRFAITRLALIAPLLLALPLAPAYARPVPLNPDGDSWQSLFTEGGWGPVIAVVLIFAVIVGGFIALRRQPLTADIKRQKEDFWANMPMNSEGYKGVLYDDKLLGARGMAAGPFFAQRIFVELRNNDPSKSKQLFHNKEQPNVVKPELSEEALSLWITTARDKDLPAVYTTHNGIYVLPAGYYGHVEKDPKSFLKAFKRNTLRDRSMPDV